jgi:non-heme chloroperoxidase
MPYNATPDGARTFYKDWGDGQPVVFSHGWPLTSDAWDVELMMVADHGFRGIAHDRRGHGRSSHTWGGMTWTPTWPIWPR